MFIHEDSDKMILTTIGIGLGAVAILQSISPGTLVPGIGSGRLPYSVAPFEALRPLAPVQPPAPCLHPQPVPLAILPLSFKRAPTANNNNNNYSMAQQLLKSFDRRLITMKLTKT